LLGESNPGNTRPGPTHTRERAVSRSRLVAFASAGSSILSSTVTDSITASCHCPKIHRADVAFVVIPTDFANLRRRLENRAGSGPCQKHDFPRGRAANPGSHEVEKVFVCLQCYKLTEYEALHSSAAFPFIPTSACSISRLLASAFRPASRDRSPVARGHHLFTRRLLDCDDSIANATLRSVPRLLGNRKPRLPRSLSTSSQASQSPQGTARLLASQRATCLCTAGDPRVAVYGVQSMSSEGNVSGRGTSSSPGSGPIAPKSDPMYSTLTVLPFSSSMNINPAGPGFSPSNGQ